MYIAQLTSKKGVHKRKFPYNANSSRAYHWTYVLRYKTKKNRELIAEGMEHAIAAKKYIKYNNGSKACDLYTDVKPKHFDCKKLVKKTYANCCNLVAVACRYAGIKTPKKNSSLTLHKKWVEYGFKRIKYKPGMELKRGDVLVCTTKAHPHTAVVL